MAGNSSTSGVGNVIISVQRSLKNADVLRTAQRALQRIVPEHIFVINHFVFVQASIQTALDESKDTAPIASLQHRFATIHDRELLTCGGLSLNEVQRHFEAGERAAVTTTPGWILLGHPRYWDSYGWIRYNVSANEFWGAHNFVVPAYRGQKVARQSRDFAYEQLLSEGFEWGTSVVHTLNCSSMRVWSTPANKIIGRVFYVRIGHLIVYRLGRKWGIGFYAGGLPFEVSATDLEVAGQKKFWGTLKLGIDHYKC